MNTGGATDQDAWNEVHLACGDVVPWEIANMLLLEAFPISTSGVDTGNAPLEAIYTALKNQGKTVTTAVARSIQAEVGDSIPWGAASRVVQKLFPLQPIQSQVTPGRPGPHAEPLIMEAELYPLQPIQLLPNQLPETNCMVGHILTEGVKLVESKDTTAIRDPTNPSQPRIENTKVDSSIRDEDKLDEEVVFKIQIASSKNKIQLKSYNFKGLKNVQRVKVGSYYKYYFGVTTIYNKVKNSLLKAKSKGYSDAYIAAFKKGKKVSLTEVLK